MNLPGIARATLALTLLLPCAGLAQGDDVLRRSFPYLGNRLVVEVVADAPGTVQLLRGQRGMIEVAARAASGFPGAALAQSGSDRLQLAAVGAERAEYLVVVPENVRVHLRLPDRELAEVFGTTQPSATFDWGRAAASAAAERPPAPAPSARLDGAEDGLVVTYSDATTPRRIAIAQTPAIRAVTVRWEGRRFLIAADRPLALEPGDPEVLEIRTAGDPLALVLVVPRRAAEFVLLIGDDPVLALGAGEARVLCRPSTDLTLANGRRWFTFTPQEPRDCGAARPIIGAVR